MCFKKRNNFFFKKEDKAKIVEKYKVGDIIKGKTKDTVHLVFFQCK